MKFAVCSLRHRVIKKQPHGQNFVKITLQIFSIQALQRTPQGGLTMPLLLSTRVLSCSVITLFILRPPPIILQGKAVKRQPLEAASIRHSDFCAICFSLAAFAA
jgi:hypothetical protein